MTAYKEEINRNTPERIKEILKWWNNITLEIEYIQLQKALGILFNSGLNILSVKTFLENTTDNNEALEQKIESEILSILRQRVIQFHQEVGQQDQDLDIIFKTLEDLNKTLNPAYKHTTWIWEQNKKE